MVEISEKRCSECFFGHQIVAFVSGGDISDDGDLTKWLLAEPLKIGQTRNCFTRLQKIFSDLPPKFIYPGENDTCLNPKKYAPKDKKTTV